MGVQGEAAAAEYFSADLVFFGGSFEPGLFIGVRDGAIVSVSNERPDNAAHDLGIRVVMGRTFLDAEWGGAATRETVRDAKQRFRELRGDYEGDPLVEVSPAPHSLYGSSRPMIEAAFELAEEYDTLWYL